MQLHIVLMARAFLKENIIGVNLSTFVRRIIVCFGYHPV